MNEQQAKTFVLLPKISGALSMFGSLWVCYEIASSKKKRSHVGQRLLLGMAATDVITSFTYVLGTAPFRVEDGGSGNQATCDAQGFFGQFVPSTAIYNACLAVYYWGTIVHGWKDDRVQVRRLERFCHVFATAFAVITGAICIALDLFNPAFVHCWIYEYPVGCSKNPDMECTRGDPQLALALGWAFYYVPVWICGFGIATIAMFRVYLNVREKESRTLKYSAAASSQTSLANDNAPNGNRKQKLVISNRVANQGLWYLSAFYITWLFPTISTVMENLNLYQYWVLAILAFTLPLQGFLNWVIYIRPRFINFRAKHPEWSFLYAVYRSLSAPFNRKKDYGPEEQTEPQTNNSCAKSGIKSSTSGLNLAALAKEDDKATNEESFAAAPAAAAAAAAEDDKAENEERV